ncbi:AraC family transcriptional regulator [Microbacterium sp. No. 7]|uniref:AraC family transcriptional regulator n=1 Tax=Microbacterium sp. No. 7 TaxID=1714373 RepID=UPI0018D12CAA|nr:AraC family transcriptional regulator [Microbacterium sp. No. 7]
MSTAAEVIIVRGIFETVTRLENHTSDRDTAHVRATEAFVPHEVQLSDSHALDFHLNVAATDTLATGVMSYGTAVTIMAAPMERRYHLNFPVRGDSVVSQGGVRRSFSGASRGAAFSPHAPLLLHWTAESEQYHLSLSKARLEAHAARLVGAPVDGDIGFDLTFDLSSPRGQTVLSMTRFLHAELSREDGIASIPVALHEFESSLMTQVLMTVPNRLSGLLEAPAGRTARERVKDAVAYLDEHAGDDIALADLSAATGMSVRALQVGFRREMGVSPTEYLRGVRLDRAHRDLVLRAGTVSEIAVRWHFYHLGRFAAQYRARFGVSPSETLRTRA